MNILGSLIKTGISINRKLRFESKSASDRQNEELRKLLEKAKKTSFGKYYGFEVKLKSSDLVAAFQREVPIFTYEVMHEKWWKQQQKYEDITWPGKPDFFALSSGTTGDSSKRIPITRDFIQSIRDVGTSMVSALPNYDLPEELFESEILMLSSSANLDRHEKGHQEGEISGINVSNFPGWYDIFYRPGKEIAAIDDWDKRLERIVKEAPNWNIGAIAGIPSWVLLMMQEIVKAHDLKNIHEIWPNLTVYASGGVAFETYRKDFEKICERPLIIMDTYLASEGFFSYTARPEAMSMELALSHGYFYEFIPFDERGFDDGGNMLDTPEVLTIADVETDQDYALLVSTCAGTWRYMIGDTIRFTSLAPHEILITGRTKFFLNVVGSQLSEEKMDAGIIEAAGEVGITVNEFSVAAMRKEEGVYYHQWVIVTDEQADEKKFAVELDQKLKDKNKNYAVARGKALKDIKVTRIDKSTYYDYLDQAKKKGGQVKTPKVMDQERMEGYLNFISS